MVYVYTMSTKEPYWTVNTIVPEQAGDTGWIQLQKLKRKEKLKHCHIRLVAVLVRSVENEII